MRLAAVAAALIVTSCAPALRSGSASSPHVVFGSVPLDRGPDGNSVFLDAPEGSILVDTGRHPDHAAKLIAYARERGRPIAAIVNTHWHLDHTTGNLDLRKAFPNASVYATTAVEGALAGFLKRGRAEGDRLLSDPTTSAEERAEILRARSVVDDPTWLRPTRPVVRSGPIRIAGRRLEVHVERQSATEKDLWIHDRASRTVISGDIVVALVPFMDTACPEGWSRALDRIAAKPFRTLIPGHGSPMSRADFLQWRAAYRNLLACGASDAPKQHCAAGWQRDAAQFIPVDRRDYVDRALAYYIDTRLRSAPGERRRYCAPLAR